MFKGLHNKLGENGQALTVLSLLEGSRLGDPEELSGSLHEISQHLYDLAGGDESELVNMYSVYPNGGGHLEFLALELVPLRQAVQRIQQINGGNDATPTLMRVVGGSDELDDDDDDDGDDGGGGPATHALSRLRDALRGLFNRAGENGQSLTILSLLSEPVQKQPPAG